MSREFLKFAEKNSTDILRYGTAQEKQRVMYNLFTAAERIENPRERISAHQFHFRLVNQLSGKPEEYRTKGKLANDCTIDTEIVDGFIPHGYTINRSSESDKKHALLALDFYRFEEQFLEFCEDYRYYLHHEDLLYDRALPKEVAALFQATQIILFKAFGIPKKISIGKYRKMYQGGRTVFLSEFKKNENEIASGVCEEFNIFAHELISLTGIARPLRIAGYVHFDADDPFKTALPIEPPLPTENKEDKDELRLMQETLQCDPGHIFSILIDVQSAPEKSYLYDSMNYWLKPDFKNGVSNIAPYVEELTKNQLNAFFMNPFANPRMNHLAIPGREPIFIDKSQLYARYYYLRPNKKFDLIEISNGLVPPN